MSFRRITLRPDQMGGVPCVRGFQIPVSLVAEMLGDGLSVDEIIDLYPDLQVEDVHEALRFAATAAR